MSSMWASQRSAGAVIGTAAVELGLVDVVGDQREERGVAVLLELALDEVGAAAALRRDVGDADDAVDALAVHDPLAGGDAVAAELDALPDRIPVPDGFR